MVRTKVYTKEKILNVAEKIAVDKDFSSLTARNIAETMGISTQPIYLEFVNMDDLKRTLIKSLFHRMQLFYKADVGASDPAIALGLNFILFAQKHQKIYKALFMKAHGYEEELQQMLQTFFEERLLLDKKYVQMDKGKFVELFPKMVVIYLGLATAVTMKTIDLTKNQEIQLLSQLLIEE
ncbi:TetR/AcrR family transcriptional regulator [Enterococcus faecalis]|nr:TetR/AcrR family transcriptional regulator [Enterococcus faecalis]EGO9001290.1 TetR family transcriptional regulator [Enterococcus faecalis]EGO9003142.1 TetR family transcriptional regulator [Enterococcus faecalis]MDB1623349.1 TetR/AcrR family transcriptional regulator [Enterococcus faecalis]RBR49451.1 TetR family transcriptional regulator [Enterococcus faecalis]TQB31137.1 TetR/AcrR family transcriptional regulator [Enterococcus faecalis]